MKRATAPPSILGNVFYQGPEIVKPSPIDFTLSPKDVLARRRDWVTEMDQAVRDHGAWAVVVQYPNGDVELFDTRWPSLVRATRRGGNAWLGKLAICSLGRQGGGECW
jgi:hypothetical protein